MKQKIIQFILAYFKFFARLQLSKNSPIIIGITGSAGKTSVRDAIYSILKEKRKVKVSYKANSETGIPLNILGLKLDNFSLLDWAKLIIMCPIKLITNWEEYDTYIVEMGIDSPLEPKNMEYLLKIVKPHIGIILNANATHSQPFDFLVQTNDLNKRSSELVKLIAKEKGKIVTKLRKNDFAIINSDQKEILDLKNKIKAKTLMFGTNDKSTVKFSSYLVNLKGTTFEFKYKNQLATINIKNELLAKHYGMTFAAAICVGLSFKIEFQTSAKLIEDNFILPRGRSSLIAGINDSLIIDSSYNSSKKPLLEMLDLIDTLPAKRKIAILGDIRELGKVAKIEHEEIAKKSIKVCDVVLLVGPQMKNFALPIIKKSKIEIYWFANAFEAANFWKNKIRKEDLILIKGSQNTLLLEIAVEILMKKPSDAQKLLSRRGQFWDKKREEIITSRRT